MVLFVVGDVDVDHIYNVVADHENQRDKTNQPRIVRDSLKEQDSVKEKVVTEKMKLQSPRIMLGFKNMPLTDVPDRLLVKKDLEMTLFFQFVLEPTYRFSMITSATQQPDKLKKLLLDELEAKQGNLTDTEAFNLLKKQFIGEFISGLNSPEYIANQYTKLYFEGVSLFDLL